MLLVGDFNYLKLKKICHGVLNDAIQKESCIFQRSKEMAERCFQVSAKFCGDIFLHVFLGIKL